MRKNLGMFYSFTEKLIVSRSQFTLIYVAFLPSGIFISASTYYHARGKASRVFKFSYCPVHWADRGTVWDMYEAAA